MILAYGSWSAQIFEKISAILSGFDSMALLMFAGKLFLSSILFLCMPVTFTLAKRGSAHVFTVFFFK